MSKVTLLVNVSANTEIVGEDAAAFLALSEEQRIARASEIKEEVDAWFRENMDGEPSIDIDVTVKEIPDVSSQGPTRTINVMSSTV